MTQDILTGLNETTSELQEVISKFLQEQFNKVPFEGSWTAGQVAEHLLKSERAIKMVLSGGTKPTERAPDAHVAMIRSLFLDFTTKMKSPDFIIPGDGPHDRDTLYNALKVNKAELLHYAETKDLALTFTDFPMPGLDEPTGIELTNFAIVHAKRHIHQLRNIWEQVK